MDNFERQSTNDIDIVASEEIEFPTLYSILQHDYEGSNIPNIITLLLNIYHPEDGIAAYERVLRKVQSFLENCDSHKKQLLLSMIPVPNNVPDRMIEQAFRTTTGFIKLSLQEKTMDNGVSSLKSGFLYGKNASNSKLSLPEAFPFRGFSESEISRVHSHAKNANHLYRTTEFDFPRSEIPVDVNPNSTSYINQQASSSSCRQLNDNSNNWIDRNDKQHQMSSCRQYLLNKKYCTLARNSTGKNLSSSTHAANQDARSMKAYNSLEREANVLRDKIPQQLNDIKCESKHLTACENTCAFNKDKKSGVSYMIIDIGQNATIRRTINDNVHKMDVCCDEDQNIVVDADDLLAPARDRLKRSISNFLKRAQEGISVEPPAFPRTRSCQQVDSSSSTYLTSKDRKSGTPRKALETNFTSSVSSSDNNSSLSKYRSTNINSGKNQRTPDKKTKQAAFARVSESQTQCNSQKLSKAAKSQTLRNNSNCMRRAEKKAMAVEREGNDTSKESIYGCKPAGSRTNGANPKNNFQAHSISQLAAYKKRYYDTLLSVQRAKVAVTNSLASSTSRLAGYDDPYYANHAPKHLFQRCHFAAGPRFSTCSTTPLSGLSSVHDDQYSWAKSDCKYLLLKQLRLQRQNSPLYDQNQSDWMQRYVGPAHPYSFMPSGGDQTRHCARRKSLEDIVGKLKETELDGNVDN